MKSCVCRDCGQQVLGNSSERSLLSAGGHTSPHIEITVWRKGRGKELEHSILLVKNIEAVETIDQKVLKITHNCLFATLSCILH